MLQPEVYDRLRALAHRHFSGAHTLQPTALVHEAYMKLAAYDTERFTDQAHFVATAITAMRQIMVDHARAKARLKRGGPHAQRVTLTGIEGWQGGQLVDVLGLDQALTQLAELDERQARAVELRFFGGLSVAEVAQVLEVSVPTAERDLRRARAWLRMTLES